MKELSLNQAEKAIGYQLSATRIGSVTDFKLTCWQASAWLVIREA
jgi:hypothetical protein